MKDLLGWTSRIRDRTAPGTVTPTRSNGTESSGLGPLEVISAADKVAVRERINPHNNDCLLIVGSGPSIGEHIETIRDFAGPRWALNDSAFWMNDIGVVPQAVFITDMRYVRKVNNRLKRLRAHALLTLDNVIVPQDVRPDCAHYVLQSLGRDGFSTRFGRVFHGCSVVFSAVQTAVALRFTSVAFCGVVLPPPLQYKRIDQSSALPQYVYDTQIRNARLMLEELRSRSINVSVAEDKSALNVL